MLIKIVVLYKQNETLISSDETLLFATHAKPHKSPWKDKICWWFLEMLSRSDVETSIYTYHHCVKIVNYAVLSDPYFPVFGMNMVFYGRNVHIHSKYRKTRNRQKSIFGHFLRSAQHQKCIFVKVSVM